MSCTDWEMGQSYREWRDKYEEEWETAFRQTYEDKMMQRDTHFYVGTVHRHPTEWIIVGLFYPPYPRHGTYSTERGRQLRPRDVI